MVSETSKRSRGLKLKSPVVFWKHLMISPSTSILQAIQTIDHGGIQIAFVVNKKGQLLGSITDGDVRRGILRGVPLEASATKVMNRKPLVAHPHESRETIIAAMKKLGIRQAPVVDEERCMIGVEVANDFIERGERPNWVVLMVGGQGNRLRPLTDNCPKPLLKVGDRPLLETIIRSFIEYGFQKFYLAGHFRLDMVKNYFGNGDFLGATIRYIHEEVPLGTAGALGLFPEIPEDSFFVMNGDLLTKVNFRHLLDFHKEQDAKVTMCVAEYDLSIPYGVVKIDNGYVEGIDEKPVQHVFINAGIYVVEPEVISLVPKNKYCDMPQLLEKLNKKGSETTVFPIREYWLDIGHLADYKKANGEFNEVFK